MFLDQLACVDNTSTEAVNISWTQGIVNACEFVMNAVTSTYIMTDR